MIVDSSVWIEIFLKGPLADRCKKEVRNAEARIPSLCFYEIYKTIKQRASEELALQATGALSSYPVEALSREIALSAGDLSLKHGLAMADSLVLAHAVHSGTSLLTLDNDFARIPEARVLR